MLNFTKIRPLGAEVFHADVQTDGQPERHDDTNNLYSKFCERT